MKSLMRLFLLVLIGYLVYPYVVGYINKHHAASAPIKDSPPVKADGVEISDGAAVTSTIPPGSPPNLSSLIVYTMPLTNVKVREIHKHYVILLCDQGLMQVYYEQLPASFSEYYAPQAVADAPPPAPRPIAHKSAAAGNPYRTAIEEAAAHSRYLQQVAGLEQRIKGDQFVIDSWYLPLFNNPSHPSVTQYESAKADLGLAAIQLSELKACGEM